MAGYIKMDFAGVEGLSSKLNGQAERSLSDVANLANQANPQDVWNGPAADGYQRAFERWEKAQKEEQEALKSLANAVTKIKENYEQVTTQGTASFDQFFQ